MSNPSPKERLRRRAVELILKGQYSDGISLLEACCQPQPHDISDLWYLGIALLLNGDEDTAQLTWISVLSQVEDPEEAQQDLLQILDELALLLLQNKQGLAARTLYDCIQEIDATYSNAYLGLAVSYFQTAEYEEAIPYFQEYLVRNPELETTYYQLADCFVAVNDLNSAISLLEQALKSHPEFHQAYFKLSELLCKKLDSPEIDELNKASIYKVMAHFADQALANDQFVGAEHCFENIIKYFPNDAYAHYGLALTYHKNASTNSQKIIKLYQRAIELDSEVIGYYTKLAQYLESINEVESAFQIIRKALKIDSDHLPSLYLLGVLEFDLQQIDKAKGTFEEILDSYPLQDHQSLDSSTVSNLSAVYYRLGLIYDKEQESTDAFEKFSKANQLKFAIQKSHVKEQRERESKYIQKLTDLFENQTVDFTYFKPIDNKYETLNPVFLTGFPRSGTTLAGRILDSHSQVNVLVEKIALHNANISTKAINFETVLSDFTVLQSIPTELIQKTREKYIDLAMTYIDHDSDKKLVDEHPFHILWLWFIHKIYPDSRFIFVLRHPCDVVLSCFMQNFHLNKYTANFLTLNETVKFYIQTMQLWNLQREALNLTVHTVVYEKLVENIEAEIRPLLDYLGLPWEESVENFHNNKNREQVRTASYRQVTQPIYTQAKYRWQRYREYLEPYLDDLMPFMEQWGYEV